MKKKIFAIFLSLMMVTSLMTACGNSGKNNEKETSPEGSQTETADTGSEGKGKTITITSYDANPYALDEFAEMVAKFEADHPGVKVEIQHVHNDGYLSEICLFLPKIRSFLQRGLTKKKEECNILTYPISQLNPSGFSLSNLSFFIPAKSGIILITFLSNFRTIERTGGP